MTEPVSETAAQADRPDTTPLPPFVLPGERDWRPAREAWKGPLSHPYDGWTAYTRIMPNGERRIYPSKEAADAAE